MSATAIVLVNQDMFRRLLAITGRPFRPEMTV